MKRYDYLGDGFAVVMAVLQTEELFKIISLICAIIASCLSILYTLYQWYKKANEDGKITTEEVKEGVALLKEEASKNKVKWKHLKALMLKIKAIFSKRKDE